MFQAQAQAQAQAWLVHLRYGGEGAGSILIRPWTLLQPRRRFHSKPFLYAPVSILEYRDCQTQLPNEIWRSTTPRTSFLAKFETPAFMMAISTTIPQSPLPIHKSFLFSYGPTPRTGQAVFSPYFSPQLYIDIL